ncbi:MAG: response regulator [Actinobacteria bacterium]|nr:MAG: response regulator [Actinomycetota bacterium]
MGSILVVDDDPAVASRVAAALDREGFKPVLAGSGRTALAFAGRESPDLVLLDVVLPDCDGYELCRILRRNEATSSVPVLMLLPKGRSAENEDDPLLSIAGYLRKPVQDAELIEQIRSHLRRHASQEGLHLVTQLPGRLEFERHLDDRLRDGQKFAVLWVDVDDFQSYNERHGLAGGDELLRFMASLVRETAGEEGACGFEFAGHLGADDFVLLTSPSKAKRCCKTMIRRFDERCPGMKLYIVVVSNEQRAIAHRSEVAQIAKQLRRVAKAKPGSSYHFDKRRTAVQS